MLFQASEEYQPWRQQHSWEITERTTLFPGSPWNPCTNQCQGCLQVLQPQILPWVLAGYMAQPPALSERVLSLSKVPTAPGSTGTPFPGSLSCCCACPPRSVGRRLEKGWILPQALGLVTLAWSGGCDDPFRGRW